MVTLTVTDDDGAPASATRIVTVENAAPFVDGGLDRIANEGELISLPVADLIELGDQEFGARTFVRLAGSFQDPGALDSHTATIDWGDGTAEIAPVTVRRSGPQGAPTGASGIVQGGHRYTADGIYTILVAVTDDDGAVGSDSFTVTVSGNPDNNPPTANDDDATTNEESPVIIDVLANDIFPPDPDETEILSVTSVAQPGHGTAAIDLNGTVTYSPNVNFFGSDEFGYTISDGQAGTASATVRVSVRAVNDAPNFAAGPDEIVQAGAGSQSVVAWAKNSTAGPSNEAGQSLRFTVTTDNAALFAVLPAISADGTLSYTPATNIRGVASIIVQLGDDGGTENDGQDMSVARTFTITLLANGGACIVPMRATATNFLGNIRARMSKGTLMLIGDAANNSISIGAGSVHGYFRVSGIGDTAVNSRAASTELGPVTKSIRVRLGGGSDNLVLDATAGAMVVPGKLVVSDSPGDSVSLDGDKRTLPDRNSVAIIDALLERGLTVRMRSSNDVASSCGVTSSGPVRVRTGRGSDTVLIDDFMLHDVARVNTGRGPDVVSVETNGESAGPPTVFQKCVRVRTRRGNDAITLGSPAGPGNAVQTPACTKIRGGRGVDSLNAGLSSDPNSNGNEFAKPPDTRGIEQQSS